MEQKTSPKDVFLHLLAVASLYVSAVSLITLLFQYVNYWFPDQLNPFVAGDAIRWAIASLLIIVPVHALVVRYMHRDFEAHPEKREFRLRKWLLYLTLFVAAVALIGDLVALIYNFLSGELTMRFLMKIAAIAVVAGGVFWYYWWELRRRDVNVSSRAKTTLWGAATLVLLSVIGGFFIVGSPFKQRDIRFDQRRVQDLQNIQYQVLNYWQQKDALPASLDLLKDQFSGYIPPVDPETSEPYEYRSTGALSFELCATFKTGSKDDPNMRVESFAPYPYQDPAFQLFLHEEGRKCFSRTIDPDLYRIGKPLPR